MQKRLHKIWAWIGERLQQTLAHDRFIFAWLAGFGIATTTSAVIVAIGNPIGDTLSAHALHISKVVAINGLLFLVCSVALAVLFSLIYLRLPRFLVASFSYTAISSIIILTQSKSGTLFSSIVGIGYSLIVLCIISLGILFFHKNINNIIKISTLVAVLIIVTIVLVINHNDRQRNILPEIDAYTIADVTNEDPAKPGEYDYDFFTYGSGYDENREWFGEAVDETTPTVNASHFITKWGEEREDFWGFDQTELPINGRAWLPKGEGDFPVVLMVHGNHTMEYFSTSGYDYLGELLASKGFIAISVDEDFINYSNIFGSPNKNYKLRTWMIMQHLAQLQQMNNDPDHLFHEKIAFDQVGLMGHSRGGQAVLMAEDYERFFEDEEDEEFRKSMESINIAGIVAIAPTDKQIDDKKPRIHNTSYLLMHGARDADVSDYRSDRQFYRATFDQNNDGFKASIYIGGANHTQFNTDWGSSDLSLPRGIFLNKKQILPPTEQQQIAKVYMSAFFESVFTENVSYDQLFQNYRYGKDWLPDTALVSKYQHASFESIKKYNQESEAIKTDGFSEAKVVTPKHRRDHDRFQKALQLEWEKEASLPIQLENVDLEAKERLVLTMANINDEEKNHSVPEIDVELEMTDGRSVRLPLDDFMSFQPIIETDYTHFGLFDSIFREGRYKNSWEPIFQTFEIPIEAFEETSPELERNQVQKMTLHFSAHLGKILIEEIGVH